MICLAIDTTNTSASIAISKNNELLFSSFFNLRITHSETLMPEIDRALSLCKLSVAMLDYIAVAIGPGSFTGLRIGLATAKGLSFAYQIPIIPISSLKIVAMSYYKNRKNILVFQDAKMKEVYIALYTSELEELIPPTCVNPSQVSQLIKNPTIVVGTGLSSYSHLLLDNKNIEINAISEKNISKAESIFSIISIEDIHPTFDFDFNTRLEPFYIRKSQAEVNLEKENQ